MLAKRSLPLLVVCIATASFAGPKHHQNNKLWKEQYKQINHMFETRDTATFENLLAPDYYELETTGSKTNRDDFIKNDVEPMKHADKVKSHVDITKIKEKGDDAEISYDWKYTIWMGQTKTMGHQTGTDGWHKTGGQWMNVWTKVKSSTEKTKKIKARHKK